MAKYRVNKAGVSYARSLIDSGQYVVRSRWTDRQPSSDAENDFLKSHDWKTYGKWHLAIREESTAETKGHFAFVFGDFKRVHRSALIACYFRAAEWDHKEIELAAHRVLQHLDKTRKK